MAFEQSAACQRQQQLCKNQINKTEIVIKEVEQTKHKLYKAVGRMFVLADPNAIKQYLTHDLDKIKGENDRSAELQKTYEAKKAILTQQLNDLTPKTN